MMFRFAVFALAIVAFVQSEQVLKYNPVPSDSNGKGLSIQHLDVAKPADRADNKTPKSDPAVKPAFCNKLSCPSYAVLNKTDVSQLMHMWIYRWNLFQFFGSLSVKNNFFPLAIVLPPVFICCRRLMYRI